MGAKGSAAALQSLLDKLFLDIRKSKCAAFFDDIISGAKSFQEMIENLCIIFERLRIAKLMIKALKTKLFRDHVIFVGCKLNADGIAANKFKIEALLDMIEPKNKKDVQIFLGLANYFREFISNFAEKAIGLTNTLKGDKFDFDFKARKSFNDLTKALTEAPVLAWPREDIPFELYCDSSDLALGFVLLQRHNNIPKPVYYGSKCLNESQLHWPSFVKEMYAVYTAVKRLHYYLYGKKFQLFTDCQGITYERTLWKGTSTALQRWCIELSQYDFDIKYIKGKNNVVSDCLSRLPSKSCQLYDHYLKAITEYHNPNNSNKHQHQKMI